MNNKKKTSKFLFSPLKAPLKFIEAALTPYGIDRYIELVNPAATIFDARAKIVAIDRLSPATIMITLQPNRAFSGCLAGQFVGVAPIINGVRQNRCYSPLHPTVPGQRFQIAVTRTEQGLVSNFFNDEAKIGDVVALGTANGTFVLPDQLPPAIQFVSGGSGFTPIIAMLHQLAEQHYSGQLSVVHFAKNPEIFAPAPLLRSLQSQLPQLRLTAGFTQTSPTEYSGFNIITGRLTPELLDPKQTTFACGPQTLIDHARSLIDPDKFFSETFTIDIPVHIDGNPSGTIFLTKSSLALDNNGKTILDQAEAAGLQPEAGCRMGICFTCTTRKKCGAVQHIRTGEINDEPDTDIQICVSRPSGDVELEL